VKWQAQHAAVCDGYFKMLSGAVQQQHAQSFTTTPSCSCCLCLSYRVTHIQGPQLPDSSTATASAVERQPGNRKQRLRQQLLHLKASEYWRHTVQYIVFNRSALSWQPASLQAVLYSYTDATSTLWKAQGSFVIQSQFRHHSKPT
jgi:hypothetical protein